MYLATSTIPTLAPSAPTSTRQVPYDRREPDHGPLREPYHSDGSVQDHGPDFFDNTNILATPRDNRLVTPEGLERDPVNFEYSRFIGTQSWCEEQTRLEVQTRLDKGTQRAARLLPFSREPVYHMIQAVDTEISSRRALELFVGTRNYRQSQLFNSPETYLWDSIHSLSRRFPGLNAPGILEPSEQPFRLEASIQASYLHLQITMLRVMNDE
jgi:hypothetical protein